MNAMGKAYPRRHRKAEPMILALEPRIMFDGAGAVEAAQAMAEADDAPAPAAAPAATPPERKEVAFVDTSVADYRGLADSVRAGVETVLIDGGQSGLAQMAEWAKTHSGYDAIHVLSHGSEGVLRLGRDIVDAASLSDDDVRSDLSALGQALNADGDILVYGCSVAAGDAGQAFIDALATATGADVAASTDSTGAAARKGDWVLEAGTSDVAALSFGAYGGILGTAATLDLNGGDAGTGNIVTLASAAGGLATSTAIADDVDDAWNGGTLTVQRVTAGGAADGNLNDIFAFGSGVVSNRTITRGQNVADGTLSIGGTQIAGWTYTSATGQLLITFNNDAANAHVQSVVRAIGYSNATPYGTATVRFALDDGEFVTNADVSVTSSTIYVDQTAYDTDGDGADGFNLAEALAKAVDGDTIKIQGGTYRGQFRASNAVTIEAAGTGTVTLEAPDTADIVASAQNSLYNRLRYAILDLRTTTPDSGTVTVRNLTIDGRYQAPDTGGNGNEDMLGIATYDTNAVIDGVTVKHIASTLDGVTGEYSGYSENYGILAEANGANPVTVTIKNCTIGTFQKTGIIAWGAGLTAIIQNNSITAVGVLGISNQNGMQIGSSGARAGTVATITGNTITNLGSNDSEYAASGIIVRQAGVCEIANNTFRSSGVPVFGGSTTGIAVFETSASLNVHDNDLGNVNYGVLVESPWGTVYNGTHTFANNNSTGTYYALLDSHAIEDGALAANAETITVNSGATINNGRGFVEYLLYDGIDVFTDTGAAATHIDGGAGNDSLSTGSGNDEIAGGEGSDVLTGGGGGDVFILSAADTITDFSTRYDSMRIKDAVVPVGRMSVSTSGADAVLSIDSDGVGGTDMVITLRGLAGVTVADLRVTNNGTDTTITINRNPVASGAGLSPPAGQVGTAYSFALPAATFSDADSGDTLTYSATGLPSGLTINAATGAISGNPTAVGASSVTITVTDAAGATTSKTLTIVVQAAFVAPTAPSSSPIVPVVAPPPPPLPPPAPLVTVVRDSAPAPAPVFMPPPPAPRGEASGTGIVPAFRVATVASQSDGRVALVINAPLRDTAVAEGNRISVTIPAEAFAHTKADATVTLTATRADGAALPPWIAFDPATGTFEGTPPPGFKGEVVVKVVARDNDGREAVQTFKIVVGEAGQGRTAPGQGQGQGDGGGAKPAGRASLTEQLRVLSQEGRNAKQMALFGIKRGGKAA